MHPASCGKKRKLNGLVILAVIGRNLPFLLFSLVAVANRDQTGGMMFLVLVLVLCWCVIYRIGVPRLGLCS